MKIYTFKVALKDDPFIWRLIEMKGNQTLDKLHEVIFDAFDRFDSHLYSFYLGKNIRDSSQEYTLVDEREWSKAKSAASARLDKLMLRQGQKFSYLFDFGDEWWHTIKVVSIKEGDFKGRYPRIIEKHEESPPQYPDYDYEDEEEDEDEEDEEDFDSLLEDLDVKFEKIEELPVELPWLEMAEQIIDEVEDFAVSGLQGFRELWHKISQEKIHLPPLGRVAFLSFLMENTSYMAKNFFNRIMQLPEIETKVKLDLCDLIAHKKLLNMFIVYNNIDLNRWQEINEEFKEKSRIYLCDHFFVQCIEDQKLDYPTIVFFPTPLGGFFDSLTRDAVRWAGEFSSLVKESVLHYTKADLKELFPGHYHYLTLGALDLFDAHQDVFTQEEAKDILESAIRHSHPQVRKKGYEIAANILGIESIKPGLKDKYKIVRDAVKKYIEAGGRPSPKGGKKSSKIKKIQR